MNRFAKLSLAAAAVVSLASSFAVAADIQSAPPLRRVAPVGYVAQNWSGLYFGINTGYNWFEQTNTPDFGVQPLKAHGYRLGGQVGYLYEMQNRIVLGVEAGFNWDSSKAGVVTDNCPSCDPAIFTSITQSTFKKNYSGDLVGIVGYDFNGWLMPFVGGGVSVAKVTFSDLTNTCFLGSCFTDTMSVTGYGFGPTALVGLGFKFNEWSDMRVEYRYTDYRLSSTTGTFFANRQDMTDQTMRVSFNFRPQGFGF